MTDTEEKGGAAPDASRAAHDTSDAPPARSGPAASVTAPAEAAEPKQPRPGKEGKQQKGQKGGKGGKGGKLAHRCLTSDCSVGNAAFARLCAGKALLLTARLCPLR